MPTEAETQKVESDDIQERLNLLELKLKNAEMSTARLQRMVMELLAENDEMKMFVLKMVKGQTDIMEKIKLWPFVKVITQDTDKKS
jgi:hypothetical protein